MPAAKSPIDSATTTQKNGVQSLETGLSVLDILIERREPMMLKDIAQALQMHPAKCHRYLVSLIRKDYAQQLADGRYGLGHRVDALSHRAHRPNNLLERLTLITHDIKDTLHCGVQIAKWFTEGPIIIQSVEPDSAISIITRVGSRMPLSTSATGQLFASYQSDTVIWPLVMAEWRDHETYDEMAQKRQTFSERCANIRTQGYAMVTGDMLKGINAISMPALIPSQASHIDDHSTEKHAPIGLEYAITVIGTNEQLPVHKQHDLVAQIRAIAQRYDVM